MTISIKSGKQKGRKLQKWACQKIADLLNCEWGPDKEVASREMGQAGVDIRLVGDALKKFPWSVECKNKECWAVHQWILQAKHQKKDGTDWLVIAKKNFQDPVVILDADVFFKLLGRIKDV